MDYSSLYYYRKSDVKPNRTTLETDICIYGGTSAGVVAALQASRMGRKTVLIENGGHLGGLSAGGLSSTDIGHAASVGGVAREFYRRVGQKYGLREEWRFEPHVAEEVFTEMLQESGSTVFFREFLDDVEIDQEKITSITMESGLKIRAKAFIDATYEGDLMARSGVCYYIGREPNSLYRETLNGIQVRDKHQFELSVDPYRIEGDPRSGLLPGINPTLLGRRGCGDHRVQAYNFRLCITNNQKNQIPFPKPPGYIPEQYTLLARYLAKGWDDVFRAFDMYHNQKEDMNNRGAFSTDFIGMNHEYPDGDYVTRERIFQEHVIYQQGLLWFLANDERTPKAVRIRASEWGLCRDEFTHTGGWPHQLYIREARRMVSDCVITEHHCIGKEVVVDSVGWGSYAMDSHNCQRFVDNGHVLNEGDVQVELAHPYPISYRSIVPRKKECRNLVVPVCVSASHIAYGSLRMEPVFMILGHSAAVIASLASDARCAVQDIPYNELEKVLLKTGQILSLPS